MKKEKAILKLSGGSGGRDRSDNVTVYGGGASFKKGDTFIIMRGGSGGSVSVNSDSDNNATPIAGSEILRRALTQEFPDIILDEK